MINSIPYYPYQQNVQILKGFFSKPLTLICAIVSGLTCILGMFSINTRAGSTNISFSSGTAVQFQFFYVLLLSCFMQSAVQMIQCRLAQRLLSSKYILSLK